MTKQDAIALLPLLVLGGTAVLLLLVIAFSRARGPTITLTLAGLAGTIAACYPADSEVPRLVTPLVIMDRYALFFIALIACASFTVVLLGSDGSHIGEFCLLIVLATLGSAVLASSTHFASIFLGLELLSVSLYALIAYPASALKLEAGLKYLILAGASSAFLLFGMALVYADSGSLQLAQPGLSSPSLMVLAGLGLIMVGIGFKLALAPFHLWTPDVYQGASSPVAAFIASASKGAMFVLLLRNSSVFLQSHSLLIVFACLSAASMLAGNLLALGQSSVKRILAYSSIAQLGYMLLAFVAGGPMAIPAISFYLAAYFITILGAFGCVILASTPDHEADELSDFEGLAWREPWLAVAMTAMLLSLAGLPISAGFIGKIYLMATGAASGLWWLVLVLVAGSLVGFAYYLRIIFALFRPDPGASSDESALPIPGSLAVCILTLLLLWLGIFPSPLITLIAAMRLG